VQEAKGRDELRIDVEAELAGQRMPQDPIWVERTLDELEQSPADQIRKKAQGYWCRHRRRRRRATHAQLRLLMQLSAAADVQGVVR
jgi:hypothetical protein